MKRILFVGLAVALLSAPTLAEDEAPAESAIAAEEAQATNGPSIAERILAALRLPEAATEAREAGVPEETVADVLEQAQGDGITAGDAGGVLSEGTRQVNEGSSPENFGAFVQEQLSRGLRGKDLAAAIHEAKGQAPGQAKKAAQEAKARGNDAIEDADKDVRGAAAEAGAKGKDAAKKVKAKQDKIEEEPQNPDDRDN